MIFANPLALLWGLLAIPVVLLYLRRLAVPRRPVATEMIWQQVFAEEPTRQTWQRWRDRVSLAAQLGILALVVLALAEPQIPRPRSVVLVIDNSAGMNATDVKPSRLAEAKAIAGRWIDALRDCDRAAVLTAGGAVGVRCGLTPHRPALHEALDAVPATHGPARVVDAVRLARRMLADRFGGKVVVLSDACFDGARELAAADDVQLLRIGQRTGNLALGRWQVRRGVADPMKCQVRAEVRNFGDQPADCRLETALDGRPIEAAPIRLAKNGAWRQVFEMTTAGGGRLTARLDPPDAYPDDNQRQADVPPAPLRRVVLVGEESRSLKDVFEANPLVELTIAKTPPERPAEGSILVCYRQVPAQLPAGPVLVVDPAGPCELWQLGDPLEDASVAGQDDRWPLMSDVRLAGMALPGARALKWTPAAEALVRPLAWNGQNAPLLAAIDRPQGRVLVLCGDVETGALPLSTAFPILMTNALDWLAAPGSSAATTPLSLSGRGAGGEGDLPPHARSGRGAGGEGDLPPLALSGRGAGGEGDLRVPGDVGTPSETVTVNSPGAPQWLYLVVLGLALLGGQWCLYQRRWLS